MKKLLSTIVIMSIMLLLAGCGEKTTSRNQMYLYLDTESNIYVEYNPKEVSEATVNQAFAEVEDILINIEREFSIEQTDMMIINNIEKSELMEVNENAGKEPVKVSPDFIKLIDVSNDINAKTNNVFNLAIGPLSTLWDISGKVEYCSALSYDETLCTIPTDEQIQSTLKLVDESKITINREESTVYLQEPEMKLDFGGIAKGYAADLCMDKLKTYPFPAILVNLGGNLYMYGQTKIKANQNDWYPGIRNPFYEWGMDPALVSIGTVNELNITVVTSGVYERYIEVNGTKYSHLLDSKTGYPFETDLLSVTIIGNNSALADALATGVFGMGIESGYELIKSLDGFGCIFIDKNKHIYVSPNLDFTPNLTLEAAGFSYHTLE